MRNLLLLLGCAAILGCNRPLEGPDAPWPLAPADGTGSHASPLLVWTEPGGAETYQVQVALGASFTETVLDTTVADTSVQTALSADGSYYWRVRAVGADAVWGAWSAVWRFSRERFRVAGYAALTGYAQDIAVQGDVVFVAEGQAGLSAYSLASPAEPVMLGRITDSQNEAYGVCPADTLVHVAYGYKELATYNAARPESLVVLGELEYPQPGYGYDVAVADSFVYIAADAQFIVVKVARPQYPELVFQYRYPRGCRGVAVSQGICYLALEQMGIELWDVRTLPPTRLGWLDTPSNARGIDVRGTTAFVADGRDGLLVVDAADPAQPRTIAALDLPGYAARVTIADTLALVACGDAGVCVVNVALPQMPVLAARIPGGNTRGVAASGRYIYGADRDLGIIVIERED
ncbi:MAG: hypothetical protein R6X13_12020 [bacterium]